MRFITLSVIIVLSLMTTACDSKTKALANKSLMSRPIIHPLPSDKSGQNMHASAKQSSDASN